MFRGGLVRRVYFLVLEWGIMIKSKLFYCNEEEVVKVDRCYLYIVEFG